MKKMTCRQLGGACDLEFKANSFEEIAQLSRAHGKEMFAKKDKSHLEAMQAMMELKHNPDEMKAWFENKRKEFDALADE